MQARWAGEGGRCDSAGRECLVSMRACVSRLGMALCNTATRRPFALLEFSTSHPLPRAAPPSPPPPARMSNNNRGRPRLAGLFPGGHPHLASSAASASPHTAAPRALDPWVRRLLRGNLAPFPASVPPTVAVPACLAAHMREGESHASQRSVRNPDTPAAPASTPPDPAPTDADPPAAKKAKVNNTVVRMWPLSEPLS